MSKRTQRVFVVLLLSIHTLLLLDGANRNFVVVDETAHVPSGIAHWKTGTFGAYCVNPPLSRMIATLPVLALRPKDDFSRLDALPGERSEWLLALDFMNVNRDRFFDLFKVARLAGIAWSVFGAWLAGKWARELYGDVAGLLTTALWCLEPTTIAFAQVVTPAVPASVAGLLAAYAFWAYLGGPTWTRAILCGLALGLAVATKFTLIVFYAVWPVVWLVTSRRPRRPRARWGRLSHPLAILATSLLVINLSYGFRRVGWTLGEFSFFSAAFSGEEPGVPGNRFRHGILGRVPVPLPEEYIRGIDLQRRDFEVGLPSYLAGTWRHRGWWYYYLYAMAVKLPLGHLFLFAASLATLVARRKAGDAGVFLALHAAAVLALVSSQTGFNHHVRYVLPALPFLIVGAGSLVARASRRRIVVCAAMACWSAVSVLRVHPHEMSYFNEMGGGPTGGDTHLVDSNIDWGQDLLFLKAWLDRNPDSEPIGLAYYGLVDPRIVGIRSHLPPLGPTGLFPGDAGYQSRLGPLPGVYAISVNHLRGAQFVAPDGQGGFHHTSRDDYAYFRRFRPVARAGYSILIYRITPAEANVARRDLALPPIK